MAASSRRTPSPEVWEYRSPLVSKSAARSAALTSPVARYFKAIVSSVDMECKKPDPRIFSEALSRLGSEPGETVMVGDRLDADIGGAKAMGMRTVWFRWNDKYKPEPDTELEQPDGKITGLFQLAEVIRGLDGKLEY